LNSNEAELAVPVGVHLHEGRPDEFDRVQIPDVHLDNSPGSDQVAFHDRTVLLTLNGCSGERWFATDGIARVVRRRVDEQAM
jgi:hypothetical protein